MPHRDPMADVQRKQSSIAVQHRVVLNIGVVPDADAVNVAARCDIRPNAGAFPYRDVSNHLRARVDIGGRGNLRKGTAVGTKHGAIVSYAPRKAGQLFSGKNYHFAKLL